MFTRKPNRLPHKPLYQGNNWYFVTICVQSRCEVFVEEGLSLQNLHHHRFKLNQYGKVVEQSWLNLINIFEPIYLDQYIIMPNHFHGIIGLENNVMQRNINKCVFLGDIISRFKNDSTKSFIDIFRNNIPNQISNRNGETGSPLQKSEFNPFKPWQKSFYDRIIRDEKDLNRIREYIQNNPLKWEIDELNPGNKS